ncbi:unnamed protein product [Amoebophrya sp. A120]|nr:unnamed protein product [Amoebophrya sp. A120]|eukprot:GSA120T00006540001.1
MHGVIRFLLSLATKGKFVVALQSQELPHGIAGTTTHNITSVPSSTHPENSFQAVPSPHEDTIRERPNSVSVAGSSVPNATDTAHVSVASALPVRLPDTYETEQHLIVDESGDSDKDLELMSNYFIRDTLRPSKLHRPSKLKKITANSMERELRDRPVASFSESNGTAPAKSRTLRNQTSAAHHVEESTSAARHIQSAKIISRPVAAPLQSLQAPTQLWTFLLIFVGFLAAVALFAILLCPRAYTVVAVDCWNRWVMRVLCLKNGGGPKYEQKLEHQIQALEAKLLQKEQDQAVDFRIFPSGSAFQTTTTTIRNFCNRDKAAAHGSCSPQYNCDSTADQALAWSAQDGGDHVAFNMV